MARQSPFSPKRPSDARNALIDNLALAIVGDTGDDPKAVADAIREQATGHAWIEKFAEEVRTTYFPEYEAEQFNELVGMQAYQDEKPNPLANMLRRNVERSFNILGAEAETIRQSQLDTSRKEYEAFGRKHREKFPEASDEDVDKEWDKTASELNRMRAAMGVSAGTDRLIGAEAIRAQDPVRQFQENLPLSPDEEFTKGLREYDAGGEVYRGIDDMYESIPDFLLGSAELAASSAADMALIFSWPTLLPYTKARTSEIALERAEADNRQKVTTEDFLAAAPTAIIVSAFDKLGLMRLLGQKPTGEGVGMFLTRAGTRKSPTAIAKELAKRIGTETGLEAMQELIEYTATTAGTASGFDPEMAAKVTGAGAGAGGMMAGAVTAGAGLVEAKQASKMFLSPEEEAALNEMLPDFKNDIAGPDMSDDQAFIALSDTYRVARNAVRKAGAKKYVPTYDDILAIHGKKEATAQRAQAEEQADIDAQEQPAADEEAEPATPRDQWNVNVAEAMEGKEETWHPDALAIGNEVIAGKREVLNPLDMEEGDRVAILRPGDVPPLAGTVEEVAKSDDGTENVYVRIKDEAGEQISIVTHQGRKDTDPVFTTPNAETVKESEAQAESDEKKASYDAEVRRLAEKLREDPNEEDLAQLKKFRNKEDWFLGLDDEQKTWLEGFLREQQQRIDAIKAAEEAKAAGEKSPTPETAAEPTGTEVAAPDEKKSPEEPTGPKSYSVYTAQEEFFVEAENVDEAMRIAFEQITAEPDKWGLSADFPRMEVYVSRERENPETGDIEILEESTGEVTFEPPIEDEEDVDEETEADDTDAEALAEMEELFGKEMEEAAAQAADVDEGEAGAGVGLGRADQAARADMEEAVAKAAEQAAQTTVGPFDVAEMEVKQVPAQEVLVDAKRFQFKRSDMAGKTGRLDEVEEWSPAAAGQVTLWRSPKKGQLYAVDGHQRINLAKELEARGHPPIKLNAQILDGKKITAEAARHYGASLNIGQGSATAVDAANVLRAIPVAEQGRMQRQFKQEAAMRHGAGLAKLEESVFRLYEGHFNNEARPLAPNLAAEIGLAVPAGTEGAEATQRAILEEMISDPPKNAEEARAFAREAAATATGQMVDEAQGGLFGTEQIAELALRERAKIKAGLIKSAKHRGRIAKTIATNKELVEEFAGAVDVEATRRTADQQKLTADVIEREAQMAGSPIAASLNENALALKQGSIKLEEAITNFAQAVQAHLESLTPASAGGAGRAEGHPADEETTTDLDQLGFDMGFTDPNIREARATEIEELSDLAEELSGMTDEQFRVWRRGYVSDMMELNKKQKSATHLSATERVRYQRGAKAFPMVQAEDKRRKEGGGQLAKVKDPDLTKVLKFLQDVEDAPDEAIAADIDIGEHIGPETAGLLDVGIEHGIPEAVTHDQAQDAAAIVKAFKEDRKAFVLALPTGSGKTFVMAAAVRELRALRTNGKRRINKIVYVTKNKGLIAQNRRDFEPFMKGDGARVEFITYMKLVNRDNEEVARMLDQFQNTEGTVIIFDESHAAAGQTSQTAARAREFMEAADFTVAASATPFASPKQMHYLEPTGALDPLGGFEDWAKAHGMKVSVSYTEEGFAIRRYSDEGVTSEDVASARRSLMEAGIFAYRPQRIDPERTTIEFDDAPIGELRSPGMRVLYQNIFMAGQVAVRSLRTERSRANAAMWVQNALKRVSETAKVGVSIELAQKALESEVAGEKPQVIMFSNTRSETQFGKWKYSELYEPDKKRRDSQLFTYLQMEPMQSAARNAESDMPLPFSAAIFELARRFHEMGIQEQLPSVVDEVKAAFGDELVEYHGLVSPEQRRISQKLFNEGKKRIIMATVAAGGTGLSLHDIIGAKPRVVIPLSLPWDAVSFSQMLGRATRYGMKSDVKIIIPYASNLPIESVIATRQAQRASRMGLLISGKVPKISGRIAEVIEGNEDLKPVTQAGPLRKFMEGTDKLPVGYNDLQKSLAGSLRRIVRIGVRENTNQVADVNAWLEEIGDGTALTDDERTAIESAGLTGFLASQRQNAMRDIILLSDAGEGDAAGRVIDALETYLKTRPSSDFFNHANDYEVDVKGTNGTSLAETLRDALKLSIRGAQATAYRDQLIYHSSPTRGIRKFDNRFMGKGEGAQAYGWGMYFADPGGVADFYYEKFKRDGERVFRTMGRGFFSQRQTAADLAKDYLAGWDIYAWPRMWIRQALNATPKGTRNVKAAILAEFDAQMPAMRKYYREWAARERPLKGAIAAKSLERAGLFSRLLEYRDALRYLHIADSSTRTYPAIKVPTRSDFNLSDSVDEILTAVSPHLTNEQKATFKDDMMTALREEEGMLWYTTPEQAIETAVNKISYSSRGMYEHYLLDGIRLESSQRVRDALAAVPDKKFRVKADVVARGAKYKVEISDEVEASLMRWDDPLSESPPGVVKALAQIAKDFNIGHNPQRWKSFTGRQIYNILTERTGSPAEASAKLLEYGIRGHKYKGDQAEGKYNYVLFDAGRDAKIVDETRDMLLDPNSPARRYLDDPKMWESAEDDPALQADIERIITELAELNQRILGGRARLKVERGVFMSATGNLALGNFHLKSHVMRIALDPLFNRFGDAEIRTRAGATEEEIAAEVDPINIFGHESIHAMRAMKIIDEVDWEILASVAKRDGWLDKWDIPRKYVNASEDLQIEEAIAHEFGAYLVKHQQKGRVQLIFERMAEFFRRLFGALRNRGYSTNARAEAIFRQAATGELAGGGAGGPANPPIDPSHPYSEFSDESQRRIIAAEQGLIKKTALGRMRDAFDEFGRRVSRAFEHIPKTRENAQMLEELRLLRGAVRRAGPKVSEQLEELINGLSGEELQILNAKFWMQDILWTYEQGKEIPFAIAEDTGDGRSPVQRLVAALAKAEAIIAENPKLKAAFKRREELREDYRRRLVDSGVLTPEAAKNPSYYSHQVLKYWQDREGGASGTGKVATPRVFQRRGSKLDINLDYLQVESEWQLTAERDIAIQEFLTWLGESKYNFRPAFANAARRMNEAVAAQTLKDELRRAGWKHANHENVNEANTPSVLKRTARRLGSLPDGNATPMFSAYSNIAARLFSNSILLQQATIEWLRSASEKNLKGITPYMWKLLAQLESGNLDEEMMSGDGDNPTLIDFAAFEVAQWARAPDSPASDPMKIHASAFLRAAAERRTLFKKHLVGDRFINTTSTMAIHRALDTTGAYRTWQPDAVDAKRLKITIHNAKTVPERIYQQLVALMNEQAGIDPEVVAEWVGAIKDERMLGSPSRMFILPRVVADTLDSFHDSPYESNLARSTSEVSSVFRRWFLFMPLRLFGFNLRNTGGDLDAILMNQSIKTSKTLSRHLAAAHRLLTAGGDKLPPLLQDAIDLDVVQSGYVQMQIAEPGMKEILPGSAMYTGKSKIPGAAAARGYFKGAFGISKWRENLFRLAVYINFREQAAKLKLQDGDVEGNMEKLRKHIGFGSSPRWAREGLAGDPRRLIARMARDAMGDYGDMTHYGDRLDGMLLWFWRWQETNVRRGYNNAKNAFQLPYDQYRYDGADRAQMYTKMAKSMGLMTAKKLAVGGPRLALKTAYLASHLMFYTIALALLNQGVAWMLGTDDDERPDRATGPFPPRIRRPHLEESDSYVQWNVHGAIYDALRWLGSEETLYAFQDAYAGLRSWWDVPIEVAKGPVKVFIGNMNAILKIVTELVLSKRLYPDPFNPSNLNDPGRHVMRTLALDQQYHALAGKTDASDYARDVGLAAVGATRRSATQEQRGADYDAARLARAALMEDEKAQLRRELRYAAVNKNDKAMRAATIDLMGLGLGLKEIIDTLKYTDPTFGEKKGVKAFVQADRMTRGSPQPSADVFRYVSEYWAENPITDADRQAVLAGRERLAERIRKHTEAMNRKIADAA